MKVCFERRRTEEIAVGIPGGVIAYGDEWVESNRMTRTGRSSTCYLRGRFDTVIKFDDGTYGVMDFKTSEAKPNQVSLYARQLHAYAYALENPAPRKLGLSPITRLGLLVFQPARFSHDRAGKASLAGNLTWLEIPRDDAAFLQFVDDVLSILERPAPPDGAPSCEWCQYREASRQTGL
ncbi:MAG: PD-(D/E)XK nuclease family protein [Candidatus Methylomirabilales bacterium]